jgi:DNA-binding NarL/FixJ family response regulator/tetratricopeptide (TPR) repeat protein
VAVAEHLVGRSPELASLDHVLAELDRGLPAAVEVVGEPGIGKTRLLAELSVRADARQQLVLSGSASELERDLPFWVFVDALDEYVQGLEPHRLHSMDRDVRTELARVFPSVSALGSDGDGAALQHERYRAHRAVRELLELLGATKPLVLVLDDLHWADAGSVELLGALLHRPPAAAVLMTLAVRPGRVPERLSAALERARRAETLTRIELATLTRGEAREFLGDAFDDAAATALYEESGGNPFYLEQLARSLDRGPPASPAVGEISLAGIEVPPPVAAALTQELDLLSDEARSVLEGAAVAGDPFEPELAAAAAATTEMTAMAGLDELLQFDLVRHTDVPRRFRFRHPLVRRAVYETTPGGWRLGAHERSAEALAARGAPAAVRAHHVERSARQGDATAVAILREAGEATANRAPASAARWFAAALRLVPEDAPPEERVELLLARAGSLAAIGQFSDSHAALLDSIELVPEESVALQVRLATACAGVEHLLGRHEQAHARLVSTLEALEDPASPEAVALLIELATDGFYRMEYEAMHEWAARALSAARPLGDQPLTAAALAAVAYAGALTGAITEAQTHRSEAAALVDAMPDDELALRLDAAVNLAAAEIDLELLAEAEAHAERGLAVGRATGQSALVPLLILALGWVRRLRGQLAQAGELFEGAVEGARLSGNAQSLAGNLLNVSLTALAAGDVETALTAAEESVDLTRRLDQSLMSASAGLALAAALLESGDPERAVDVLAEPSGGDELPLIPGAWRANWLELLTRCWLAFGRLDEAKHSAARAEECAAARGLGLATAMADRAAAAVALETGDPDLAASRALASAAAADDVGAPVEAALSRALAGRALTQAGRPEPAAAELQRAAAQFDACGALRYRDRAEQELRSLGHHIHRRTRAGSARGDGVESLTERELQVARLVVDRKTNPEIAAELFVSRKTVETHLRNIFRKLDVSSRVEVARAVERADRTERALAN